MESPPGRVGSPIIMNGEFLRQPATGTGQYTLHLLRALDGLLDVPPVVIVPDTGAGTLAEVSGLLDGTRARVVPVAVPRLPGAGARKVWFEQVGFPRAAGAIGRSLEETAVTVPAGGRSAPPDAPRSTAPTEDRRGTPIAHVPYFGPPWRSPLPVVVSILDVIMLVLPEHRGSRAVRAYTWLAGQSARRARRVLTLSECSRRDIVRHLGIPAERIDVTPLACDERFRPVAEPDTLDAVRRRYNLDRPFVFYLGGFDWRKNVLGLISAFEQVPGDALLAIGGALPSPGNPLFPDLPAAIRHSPAGDRIRLIGRVAEADKPALYAAAAAFAFPSRYEGFGLTVLEALACGTPVICSDAASLPEVAGDAALLVPPDDTRAWVAGLTRILEDGDLRRDLQQRGPERAAGFRWQRTAEATLAAYRQAGAHV